MDALSVLFLTAIGDLSGDAGHYRVALPARRLAARADIASVHVASNLDPHLDELLDAADVIVAHELGDPDLFPRVARARERGAVVVYDLAHDLTTLPLLHPLQGGWVEEQAQRNAFKLASLATLFTASNVRLLARWASVNPRGNLVADAWADDVHPEREPSAGFRVFMALELHEYAGARDVIEALGAWMSVVEHATLEVLAPEIVHQGFERFPADRVTLSTARGPKDRAAALRRADVALMAFDTSDYAHRASDVRWLEAAACGAVVLGPNRGATGERITHGANGLLYSEPDAIIPALDRLATDPALVAHVRKTAAEQVARERSLDASLDEQVAYWRRFVKVPAGTTKPNLPPRLPGALTAYESALFEGIFSLGPLNDREEARRRFEEAASLEPRAAEPLALLARVVPKPLEVVVGALERAPTSLRANLLLGDALQDMGQHQEALAVYQRTAELFPGWEVPYLRVALVLEGLGMAKEAEQFVRMGADVATFLEDAIEARA
jgi:tetratricopeptide (TPR) repeat protein